MSECECGAQKVPGTEWCYTCNPKYKRNVAEPLLRQAELQAAIDEWRKITETEREDFYKHGANSYSYERAMRLLKAAAR